MSSQVQSTQDKPKPIEDYLKKADILLDKRFLYFAFNCLGKNTEVQLQDGTKGQGNLYAAIIDHGGVVVKNFVENGAGREASSTKLLKRDDFVYLLVSNVEEPPVIGAKKDVFRTDTEISKNKSGLDRKLVKWSNDEPKEESGGFVLEEMADQKGKWNQFEVNEKRFGLTSDFHEHMYTTHLDMKNVPAALLAKASKLEEEILNDTSEFENRHIREERGLQALKEDNEDEEFAYSSVIRTDSKTSKKGDKAKAAAAEEKAPKKFFNSKKAGGDSLAPLPPDTKKETKDAPVPTPPAVVQTNRKELTPNVTTSAATNNSTIPKTEPLNIKLKQEELTLPAAQIKSKEVEKTPKNGEPSEKSEGHKASRQDSNISEDASGSNRTKPRLSIKATTFETPFDIKPKEEIKVKEEVKPKDEAVVKPKEEEKPKPGVQNPTSLEAEEKKFSMGDYNSGIISKFKLKVNEKEIKKSNSLFYDYTVPNWQKKLTHADPANVNISWKAAKASSVNIAINKIPSVSQATTAKPFKPPAAPFTGSGVQPFRPNDGMMYPQPFVNPGFAPNPQMPYMPYPIPQKFTPAFPYPQQQAYPFPQFVDPTQPSFNMNYQHNAGNNPRQGQPKNFNKNKN